MVFKDSGVDRKGPGMGDRRAFFATKTLSVAGVVLSAALGGAPRVAPANEAPPSDGTAVADAGSEPQPVVVHVPAALALQGFAVSNKVMPGVALRLGKYWGPRLEASFIWTTDPVAGHGAFLGNQFAVYLEATPLRVASFELSVGLGTDVYYLWAIHGDLARISLSAEANMSYWVTPRFGVLLGFRGYPLESEGLELGTRRDGSSGTRSRGPAARA